MNVVLEIKQGLRIKVASGKECGCFNCVFTNYFLNECPGVELCNFLDNCEPGVYHYFELE